MTDFKELIERIRKEEVTLFIGSGFSLKAGGPKSSALVESILSQMKEEEKSCLSGHQLDYVAEEYEQFYGRDSLLNIIEKEMDFDRIDMTDHEDLPLIPHFHRIITTNYDTLLEDAYGTNNCYVVRNTNDCLNLPSDKTQIFMNFSGPNHTIPMEAVREGKSLRSRRYRNRRLGEFLKELDLTEGRATGIPTIQDELKANGSSRATIETDEERTYFLIDIPCHPEFVKDRVVLNKDFIKDFIKGFIKENRAQVSERQEEILSMIADDETLTSQKIAQKTGVSQRTILKDLTQLQALGILAREGGRKEGTWVIVLT